MTGQAGPLLLATVGSDHHPFDRLVGWVDSYLAVSGPADLRYFCQHATAGAPRTGEHEAYVDHQVLLDLVGEATVVVSHGGPGTLLEIRRSGRIPIAVPRRQHLGEAVDDHQHAFCRFLAALREVVLADSEEDLHAALDRMLADPTAFRSPSLPVGDPAVTLERFSHFLAECHHARRRRALGSLRLRAVGARSPAAG